jgi:hypothetical protein
MASVKTESIGDSAQGYVQLTANYLFSKHRMFHLAKVTFGPPLPAER